jgi:hypothetical protein
VKLNTAQNRRGEFESNSVVSAIQEHIKHKTALGDELIGRMSHIR